jgi:hypothetical protein
MYVIRSRTTIHDSNRRYCCKDVPHFDGCNSVSCLQNARRGLNVSLRGGIVGATQKKISSQKPDDFGWKGEKRIDKKKRRFRKT